MKKDVAISLIELPSTVDGRLYGTLAKDIYSLQNYPARGVPLLTAELKAAGFQNTVAINPKYNRNKTGHLDDADWKRLAASDVVGISAITRTAPQSFELARKLKEVNPRIKVLFGGPHPTALPHESLEYGDLVITHEGDFTLPEVMRRFSDDFENPALDDILGIAYKTADGEVKLNKDRPFLTSEELSSLPFPEFTANEIKHITHNVVNTSRGCPFECEYCSVIDNFGRQFRFTDDDYTVELIKHTIAIKHRPIFFGDDIFNANRGRVKRILSKILSDGVKMPRWFAQVRVESACDPEMLQLMAKAGCSYVFIGLESVNDETLRLYHKHSTLEKNRLAIDAFHKYGIRVHGMFVLGSEADTTDTIKDTFEFAKEMNIDSAQFFALTAVPGPPMTARYEQEGKVIASGKWHLYDAQHAVVRPKKMTPYELQAGTIRASLDFYSYREAFRHLFAGRGIFNFLIRVKGKQLAKRIVADNQEFMASLKQLDEWQVGLGNEFETWHEWATRIIEDSSLEIDEKLEHIHSYVNEKRKELAASYQSVQQEFRPYCQALADRMVEKLRQQFENTIRGSEEGVALA
ncbi:MAG TPA: radical SAM protein [Blastocatellia bacterium]|nr:radical SAM protein [Blastocatellia bacterium]